jgi:hypothetical protein
VVESGENDDFNIVTVAGSLAGSQHQLFGSTVSTATSFIYHCTYTAKAAASIAQYSHTYNTNFLAITATSRLIYRLKNGSELTLIVPRNATERHVLMSTPLPYYARPILEEIRRN